MPLAEIIKKADALKAELAKLKPLKREDEERLRKKFTLEWNYNSNHIEGNTLTYHQTELLLIFDQAVGDSTGREIEEMKAHNVAIKMVEELALDKEHPLNETFIKKLNEVILVRPFWKEAITEDGQDTRKLITVGDYKNTPNSVRLTTGEIFRYTSPEETPAMMGDLLQFYRDNVNKKDVHALWLAAMMHYKFVRIHPFDDGNGRIARLVMNYVFLKNDFPPVIIKAKDKRGYLTALNKADAGDENAFVEYIGNELLWSLEISIQAAKGESIEEEDDHEKEISIWKQQLQTSPDVLPKSIKHIVKLYENSFKPLFKLFTEKMKQFDDLFASKMVYGVINDGGISNDNSQMILEYLDKKFDEFMNKTTTSDNIATLKDLDKVILQINFLDFKKNGLEVFNHNAILRISFEKFSYSISFNTQKMREGFYSIPLSSEDIKALVSDCVKATFTTIKGKTKK